MRIKDERIALYSAGLPRIATENLIAVGGVDAAGNYQLIHLDAAGNIVVNVSLGSAKATYISAFSVVAAGAGICVVIEGSATKTVKVLEIYIDKPTVGATFTFIKQSTVGAGGVSAAQTLVPVDSASAAASAVILAYTAVPAAGALVGNVFIAAMLATETRDINFQQIIGQPITLRGAAENLAISTTIAGTNTFMITFTEE